MDDQQRLKRLMDAGHPCVLIPTYEEEEAMSLLRQIAVEEGLNLRGWNVSLGVHNPLIGDPEKEAKDTESAVGGLYYLLHRPVACTTVLMDIIDHLDEPRVLRLLRDLMEKLRSTNGRLVLVDHKEQLPEALSHATTHFRLSLPTEEELERLVRETVKRHHAERPVEAKLTPQGLRSIVRNLQGLTRRQSERVIVECITDDRRLDENDINTVLARKRQMLQQGGLLEYVEAPVQLDEVAGMSRLKRWLKERERTFDEEARLYGLTPPRGVLMLGVPGAGKSFCAKAVATAWQRPLLRLDPAALYDRYIGESEKRLRDALQQAEAMSPIILWVDEIEKGFASAASQSTDGGVSQRMFGSLLTWMQEHESRVFLIATANDIQALPPELLRKGRFDEIFFVDLPSPEVRREVFRVHLEKRGQDAAGFDLDALTEASEGYTGSEIEQAVISALHTAFTSDEGLTDRMLLEALSESPPLSVTMAEHVEGLRRWAADRCLPAD